MKLKQVINTLLGAVSLINAGIIVWMVLLGLFPETTLWYAILGAFVLFLFLAAGLLGSDKK